MKAIRIPVFVLAVLLAFSVCNAVHLTRRCALWQAELTEADRAAAMGDTEAAGAALARLEALWQADQAYLHIVVSHEDIHDAETLLRRAALLCDTGNDELRHEHGGGDTADQREEYPVIYFSLRSLFSSLMKVLMSLNWR